MYVCGRFGEWRRAIPDNPTATLRLTCSCSSSKLCLSEPTSQSLSHLLYGQL